MQEALMFSDLKIVEYGDFVSVPYCSRLFADLGAKVIKVEPPDKGDMSRSYGPFPGDVPHLEKSGLFIFLNTSKQSVTLDLKNPEGRQILKNLLHEADVFITNAPPNVMEQWQLDYFSMAETHPNLIYCAITPFGWEGPYRDYRGFNLQCSALGGASWAIGSPNREPLQVPLNQCDFQGGINGAAAIMVALKAREKIGRGQFIDISVSDVIAAYTGSNSMSYLPNGLKWQRDGRRAWGSGGPYPYGLFPCRDGFVCIIARTRRDWERLLEALGHPEWADNPRYRDQIAMAREYPDEVDALLEPLLKRYTKNELFQMARKWGFPLSPVREVHESLEEPQLKSRKFFESIEVPEVGELHLPRLPFRLLNMPFRPLRPAPHLGEHNEIVVVQELGVSKKRMESLKSKEFSEWGSMKAKPLPLEGLRVIDLGWIWSGPMVAYILADFGAEVIKLEHSERLDNTRLRGNPIINGKKVEGKSIELGPYYHNVNRNKLSIRLNLKHPKGRELFKKLVKVSDVIIENFTPGALKKLRLDYEYLKEVKPDLIMLSLSTAGQEGPISDMRGYAPVISSYSGMESLVGYEGEPPLGMMTFGLSDPNAATHGLFAVMASLYHRERTGEGVFIDMSQLEASCALLAEAMLEYQMNGHIMGPQGNRHRIQSPHGIYPCNGADRWVAISVDSDENWKRLVEVIGNRDWAKDPTLQELNGRLARREVIDRGLAEWTSQIDSEEIVKTLQAHGVAAMAVSTVEQQCTDTYFQYRGVRQGVIHPLLGKELLTSVPWSLSETPGTIRKLAPILGEHDEYVYGSVLGLSSNDIRKLKEEKIIY